MASLGARGGVMEESSIVRMATVLLLYVGQGIPIGLFDFVVPAWLAANGASAADLGFVVAMTGAPWSLKFIAGFIIDRYAFLPMGRKRAWIIGAQCIMIGLLLAFAIMSPRPDQILLIGLAALVVNTATVFQDVAADGLMVDILPENERAVGSGLSAGGHTLGIAAAAALAGALVYAFGIGAAYLVAAILLSMVTAHVIWARERGGERRFPWSEGKASAISLAHKSDNWLPLFKATLANTFKPISLIWLVYLLVRGLTYGFILITIPLIATQYVNWDESQINSLNAAVQLVAGLATVTIGGLLVRWIGTQRSLLILQIFMIALLAAYVSTIEQWTNAQLFIAFALVLNLFDAMLAVGCTVFNMRLSPPEISATQFSIFMALKNQGITLAGILVASLAILSTVQNMLIFLACVQAASILILAFVKFPRRQVSDLSEAAPVPA